eukprot:5169337-Heterocapsa_arctica.AAC.1
MPGMCSTTSGPKVPSARSSASTRAHKDREAECAFIMATAASAPSPTWPGGRSRSPRQTRSGSEE